MEKQRERKRKRKRKRKREGKRKRGEGDSLPCHYSFKLAQCLSKKKVRNNKTNSIKIT